jgi:hypothetical protein
VKYTVQLEIERTRATIDKRDDFNFIGKELYGENRKKDVCVTPMKSNSLIFNHPQSKPIHI